MALIDDLDVINAACALVGVDPVQAIDDDNPDTQKIASAYETMILFNLGLYSFSFSRTIRPLSRLADVAPLTGFKYAFVLPPERLEQPEYITDDATDPDRRFDRYVLQDDHVHSDAEALHAMIRIRPPSRRWSAAFRAATVEGLAARLALIFANDQRLAQGHQVNAWGLPQDNFKGGMMGVAIRQDSHATPPRRARWAARNPFVTARFGGDT